MIVARTPDGVSHQFPDGTPEDLIDRAMQDYIAENKQPEPPPKTTARSLGQNIAAGAIEGGTAILNAATDPFGTIIGPAIARVGGTLYDAGAHVFGYPAMTPEQRADLYGLPPPPPKQQADMVGPPPPNQWPPPPEQQPIGTRIVNAATGNAAGEVPANTTAEQVARKLTGAAVGGGAGGPGAALVATGGALAGDVAGRVAPDWLAPAAELVGNVAGGMATSRAVTPLRPVTTPERGRLVEVLDAEGVPLTAGERTGSKPLLKTEQMLGQTPGSAGGVARDVAEQQAAVNRAVASRAGLNSDTLTHDVLNTHLNTVGGEIGQLAASNNMQLPMGFLQQVGQVRQNLRYEKTATAQELGARIDQLRDMITVDPATGNPVLAGPQYQNLMSDLRKAITGTADSGVRGDLIQFRDMMRQQMEASMNPADAARWRELNRHYANGMVIQDAMGAAGAGAAEGNISLLQLRGAINRSLGSDAYARGYGDLNDIARAGQSVLRKPPDSGTPQGMLINALLKGAPLATGGAGGYFGGMEGLVAGLATPWAIGTGMRGRIPGTNYSPGQAYLSNTLARNVDPRVTAAIVQAAEDEQRRNRRPPPNDLTP